jgi:SAM-dependent methyltransferase
MAMSDLTSSRREHPSTYFVQNRSNKEELGRLQIQDQMLTTSMGGVLPEQPDPTRFQHVLDVGCGTGCWLIEAAKTYPSISLLRGVDISGKMLDYAQAQARAQQVNDRVQFRMMDALRQLDFPTAFFDLVNLRAGGSYLRTWDWPNLLEECQRVSRPGGVIRVTEGDIVQSNSPALTRLGQLLLDAFFQAGHYFTSTPDGVTGQLVHLLHQQGLKNVQTRAHTLEYRVGTAEGQNFYEDMRRAYQTFKPFLRKWARVPDDYEKIYQQMLREMQEPDFVATWHLLTAWGNKPGQ